MFAAPPSPPLPRCFRYNTYVSFLCLTTAYCVAHREYHFNCVVLSKPTFRRDRKEVLCFPSTDSSPSTRYPCIFSSLTLSFLHRRERERDHISSDEFIHESNFFSLCSLGILGERGKKLKSLLITTLEKLCKLKRMKKKRKIAFSLLLSEDDTQNVEEDRPTETGRSEVVGLKIPIIHRLDSIMKPSWSDGRRNTNCPLSVLQLSRLACSRERLVGFPPILFPRTRRIESGRIDEQMEGEIKRPHNYLNGVATHHYRFDA